MPRDQVYEDENVEYAPVDNPYIVTTELKNILQQRFFILNAPLTYDSGKGLSQKGVGSFNHTDGSRSTYYPIDTNAGNSAHGMAFHGKDNRQNIVLEITANYDHKFKRHHHINAVLGYMHEDRQRKIPVIQLGNFAGSDLLYYAIGEGMSTMDKSSSVIQTKLSSFLGRVSCTLHDRYIFTVTGRYDSSPLLASGNRWNFSPSFAVTWRINQEKLMEDVPVTSDTKLRLNYGVTGNQSIAYTAPFAIMNHAHSYSGGAVAHDMVDGKLANPNLGQGGIAIYDVGLNLGFIDNCFRVTMNTYQCTTKDMLMSFGLSLSSGYGSIPYNIGKMTNKGFELEISAGILADRVKWTLGGNIYLSRSKVNDIGGSELLGTSYFVNDGIFSQSIHITKVGYPAGSLYGYVVGGVYQNEAEVKLVPFDTSQATPGSLRFKDISGPNGLPDRKITSDDMTTIGTAESKFSHSINSKLSWRGLTLSMIFTGRVGGDIANLSYYFLGSFTDTSDNIRAEAWKGKWRGEGTSNFYPAVNSSQGSSYFNKRFSTSLLEDGSFLRLKNLTLAYQLSLKKLQWLCSARIFGTVTNVFTITSYNGYGLEANVASGVMPPNVDYAVYPPSRTYFVGINLAFQHQNIEDMKKYVLSSLIGTALLSNCLGVDTVDCVEKEGEFLKTEDHTLVAINRIYSTLYAPAYHKTDWVIILPTYEDTMFSTGNAVPATASNNTHSADSAPVVNFQGELYNDIRNVSEVIAHILSTSFKSENNKNRIIAEAYFLRALYHYDLMHLCGGVNGIPIVIEPVTGIENAYIPQSSTSKVYEQVISDFEYAAGLNDDDTPHLSKRLDPAYTSGRVTNGAVHALLTEIYLALGRWEDVAREVREVIPSEQYTSANNYQNLWDIEQELLAQTEHTFSAPFFRDKDALADRSLGSSITYLFNPADMQVGGKLVSGNPYGKGAGTRRVQKQSIRHFQDDQGNLGYSDPSVNASIDESKLIPKDYRIGVIFWRRLQQKNNNTGILGSVVTVYPAAGGNSQESWGYIHKFTDPQDINNRTSGDDMPRLHLSDIYSTRAEALSEFGEYTEAYQAIGMVHKRARRVSGTERAYPKYIGSDRPDSIGCILAKREFHWLIFMGRGLGFAGEQKHWSDLIRMKYDENTQIYDYVKDTFVPPQPAADVQKQGVTAARKKYFPIPFAEVSRNDGVQQGPGY